VASRVNTVAGEVNAGLAGDAQNGVRRPTSGRHMAVPDFQSLMLPVLQAVAEDGPIAAPDLRASVARRLALSDADLAELLPSGRHTTFGNRAAWANVHLQRAGLIMVVRRGVYQVTPSGQAVLAGNPKAIDIGFLEGFPAYAQRRQRAVPPDGSEPANASHPGADASAPTNPEERIEQGHRELTADVEADLLDRLLGVTPSQFERIIVDLLVTMGYGGGRLEMAKAIGRAGDNGVDGVVREDKLGLDVVYMQAKRYAPANSVGAGEVRDFIGALDGHRASKGVFVTTSSFSRSAHEFVERVSKRVVLIDGQVLARLMVAHDVGVRVKTTYEVRELDDDYFTT
jgi:restriction system protein